MSSDARPLVKEEGGSDRYGTFVPRGSESPGSSLHRTERGISPADVTYPAITTPNLNSQKEKLRNAREKAADFFLGSPGQIFVAEYMGLALFVFIGGLSLKSGSLVVAALAHGLTLFVLICGVGPISGGHLNPAVTVALWIQGTVKAKLVFVYLAAQILGAFFGGFLIWAVVKSEYYAQINGGSLPINLHGDDAHTTEFQAIIMELVITFILVITVLLTAIDQKSNVLAAFAIGCSVLAGILAAGKIDGASMNPARSIGPLLMYTIIRPHCEFDHRECYHASSIWRTHYIHWLGPMLGAVLAAFLYKFCFAKRRNRPVEL